MATYHRATYELHRFEIVAPHVRNDGSPSGYDDDLREALARSGFTGWTELETLGYWLGKLEPGTTFVIYATPECGYDEHGNGGLTRPTAEILARIGRMCMPDQDAIQVVSFPAPVTLTEA